MKASMDDFQETAADLYDRLTSSGPYRSTHGTDILKGAAAGLIGGLVGSWVMNQVQSYTTAAAVAVLPESDEADEEQEDSSYSDEPATVQTAQAVARHTVHRNLTTQEKKIAEPAVHYRYGALVGALYGGLAEAFPSTMMCAGTAYGAALWAGGDEVAVPLLGLSKPPQDVPVSTHTSAFATHLVYGLALEGVRRGLRAIM